jgi:hypothetical protein
MIGDCRWDRREVAVTEVARTWPRWAAAVGIAIVVALSAAPYLVGSTPPTAGTTLPAFWDGLLLNVPVAMYLGLATILIVRRPTHPIPWLLLGMTIWFAATEVTAALGGSINDRSSQLGFPILVGSLLALLHLFPTGLPIAGRFGWVTVAMILALVIGIVASAASYGHHGGLAELVAQDTLVPAFLIGIVGGAVILVLRYRRSRGDERQQVKWFLFSTVGALVAFSQISRGDWMFPIVVLFPVLGITLALARYRLYDIDQVVSRTTSYVAVTALLVLTYLGVVWVLSVLLALVTASTRESGRTPPLVVATATLVAAAFARPLLRRVQVGVNRRFNRAHYDALEIADSFAARLREEVGTDVISGDLLSSVDQTLQPRTATLWLAAPPDATGRPEFQPAAAMAPPAPELQRRMEPVPLTPRRPRRDGGSTMTWRRWQRGCGWLALTTAVIWATKFALLASTGGRPSAVVSTFTGFLAPTLGSLLGLVAAFGVAAPVVARLRWWVAVPLAAVAGLATAVMISAVSNATAQLPFVAQSSSEVLRAEAPIVTTALLCAVLALWLLRPRLDSPVAALVLAIGGLLWLVKGIAVAGGADLSGWTVGVYQAGLWALLVAAVWLAVRVAHAGHVGYLAVALAVAIGTQVIGAIPVLGGELGVLVVGGLALALAVLLRRRDAGTAAAQMQPLG